MRRRTEELTTQAAAPLAVLLFDSQSRTCALPLSDVVEIMRPLPIEPVAGAPTFVRGVSVVRGQPIPVVDLAVLLAGRSEGSPGRFVVVRSGERRIALAVDSVQGKREIDPAALESLPTLLGTAPSEIGESVGLLDQRLLTCLRAGRVLFDEAWQAIEDSGQGPSNTPAGAR